jgi:hypothetical protein
VTVKEDWKNPLRLVLAGVLLPGALLLVPAAARGGKAAPAASTCPGLQMALNASVPGSTVTVSGAVSGCSLTLPSHTITLEGDGGGDDGFDGSAGAGTPILAGTDVQTTTIRKLFFRNATSFDSGAAIMISGQASPTIDQSVFTGNSASGYGGAVYIGQGTGSPNTPVLLTNSTFGGAAPNSASTGGGAVQIDLLTGLFVSGNSFTGNSATGTTGTPIGGGLRLTLLAAGQNVTQRGNVFSANQVGSANATGGGGGGEAVDGFGPATLTSLNDRFLNNSAPASGSGGGLSLDFFAGGGSFRGENLVVAGNSLNGSGGGIFARDVALDLYDSTVAGNTAGNNFEGSLGPGLRGEPGSTGTASLSLTNSVVYGNGLGPSVEISGFVTVTATFSDACESDEVGNPVPFAGGGNICVDPLLVNPAPGVADVHETAASPTIDRGSNALVPPPLAQDFEGDARIMDGNNDGVHVVDMGADERASNATAVRVSSFKARRLGAAVRVSWQATVGLESLGFHLFRERQGKLLKLNHALIPSVFGGAAAGHAYSWLDRSAPRASGKVSYRLQAVHLDGTRSWVGATAVGR